MRGLTVASVAILSAATGLAACATTATPEVRTVAAQQELSKWLAGRVAGRPQSCLPNSRATDMVVIDERTILFRDGANRVWRNDVNGPCYGLGRPGYALVTKQFGTGLCRGEIAQVVDTSTGFNVGSCSLGDFVPYNGRGLR